MTYKLPFDLKQKPVSHPLENGQIHFSCRDGVLYYKVTHTQKKLKVDVIKGVVKDKKHLDYLLSVKEFPIKIPALEIVS